MKEQSMHDEEIEPDADEAADVRTIDDARAADGAQAHTYEPEPGEVPFTELSGDARLQAASRAAKRMMVHNRELMDRLSRR